MVEEQYGWNEEGRSSHSGGKVKSGFTTPPPTLPCFSWVVVLFLCLKQSPVRDHCCCVSTNMSCHSCGQLQEIWANDPRGAHGWGSRTLTTLIKLKPTKGGNIHGGEEKYHAPELERESSTTFIKGWGIRRWSQTRMPVQWCFTSISDQWWFWWSMTSSWIHGHGLEWAWS